jgi:hypothetical protein
VAVDVWKRRQCRSNFLATCCPACRNKKSSAFKWFHSSALIIRLSVMVLAWLGLLPGGFAQSDSPLRAAFSPSHPALPRSFKHRSRLLAQGIAAQSLRSRTANAGPLL